MKNIISKIPDLLEIISESWYIDPNCFYEDLKDNKDEDSLLPWRELYGNKVPQDDILHAMLEEQAMEALYTKQAISGVDLKKFRGELLEKRKEYLGYVDWWTTPKLKSTDPVELHEEARLYRKCIENYVDRNTKYDPTSLSIKEEFEYIEILAGKIQFDYPGLGLSDKYNKEILETLVDIYLKGYDEIAEKINLTKKEHSEKARRAREQINQLFSSSK